MTEVDAPTSAGIDVGASPPSTHPGVLQPWEDPWKLAQRLANTSWVPKPFRGKPEEVIGAILYGRELGIGPITALKSIQLIDGVPTASASLMRGLILAQGHILSWRHISPQKVILYGRRRDTGSEATVIWTIQMAKEAKLTDKAVWRQFPQSMLIARATSQCGRAIFDDVLHGLIYTPEEMGQYAPPVDVIDVAELDVEPEDVDDSGSGGDGSPVDLPPAGEGGSDRPVPPSPELPLQPGDVT